MAQEEEDISIIDKIEDATDVNAKNELDVNNNGNADTNHADKIENIKELELTDEDLLNNLKKRGFDNIVSLDDLRPKVVPTEEDKLVEKNNVDKKLLQLFLEKNPLHTPEQFVAIQSVASEDPKSLASKIELKLLKNIGFTEEEALERLKLSSNIIIDDEDADLYDDIEKEKYAKFKSHQESKAILLAEKEQYAAKKMLNELTNAVEIEKEEAKIQEQISQTVKDKYISFDKNIEVELNKVSNAYNLPNFASVYPKEIVDSVKETLLNKGKREALLFNADGTENINNIFELMVKAISSDVLIKQAADYAQKHQFDYYNSKFPANPLNLIPKNQRIAEKIEAGKIVANSGSFKTSK